MSGGIWRVPARLIGLEQTIEVVTLADRGTFRGFTGNHAERRRMGERGHERRPRLRELPGAVTRRERVL